MFTNSKQLTKGKKYYFEAENTIVTYVTDNKAYSNRVGVASQSGNTFEVFVDSLMEIETARKELINEVVDFLYDGEDVENIGYTIVYGSVSQPIESGDVDSLIEEIKMYCIDDFRSYIGESLIESIKLLKGGENSER